MTNVIPSQHEGAEQLAVELRCGAVILDFPTPDSNGGVFLKDEADNSSADVLSFTQPSLHDRALKFGKNMLNNMVEKLPVLANQAVHGFGSERFWSQMRDPVEVETSFGTVHQVRRLFNSSVNPDMAENVLVINPLGTSSAGGYMAEIANIFYKEGFVVWNVSPPGFEGKLPLREAAQLNIRRETQYADEAVQLAAAELGIEPPLLHTFGGSQGGGIGIGFQNRALTHETPIGKTYALTPCSGKNQTSHRVATLYAKQFLLDEPRVLFNHIKNHPRGAIRRGMQLAPTVNLGKGARRQVLAGGIGLIFRAGHDEFIKAAQTPEVQEQLEGNVLVVILGSDVVAQGRHWPDYMTRVDAGLFHLDLLDDRYPQEAIEFFRKPRENQDQLRASS
jgi:hypothetical protein